jgi:hypothetical protein
MRERSTEPDLALTNHPKRVMPDHPPNRIFMSVQ